MNHISRRTFLATSAGATLATGCASTTCGKNKTRGTHHPLVLPALPYREKALEPVISAQTIGFHYGKHHRAYLDNLNKLLPESPFAGKSLEEIVRNSASDQRYTAIFNNAAQVWNHTFYWESLTSKNQGGEPSAALSAAITREFGSHEKCLEALSNAAVTQFGSGWAWLVAENKRLRVVKTPNAATPLTNAGTTPLLTVDVWEHAYYLDWQNRRADYVKSLLNLLVNWRKVSERWARPWVSCHSGLTAAPNDITPNLVRFSGTGPGAYEIVGE